VLFTPIACRLSYSFGYSQAKKIDTKDNAHATSRLFAGIRFVSYCRSHEQLHDKQLLIHFCQN